MEIPSYFKRYLQAIQPSKASRERAMQLDHTLTQRLREDEPFQDWFDGTFLYGSYRRNTAIQPIKDLDVCVLLDINPDDHQPSAVIDRLRRVLERNEYEAKTALQRRSVRIDHTVLASKIRLIQVVERPELLPRSSFTYPGGRRSSLPRLRPGGSLPGASRCMACFWTEPGTIPQLGAARLYLFRSSRKALYKWPRSQPFDRLARSAWGGNLWALVFSRDPRAGRGPSCPPLVDSCSHRSSSQSC